MPSPTTTQPTAATHRILIVDDDADWRGALALMLEDMGYEGVEASCGEEALRLLESEQFRIVLLDMNMPGMSGQEVVEKITDPTVRVVLLTSAAMQDVGKTLSTSPCYYLPKAAGTDALSLILQSLQM